ncbi:MAG: Stp1/IreP family PP2C-type Ser/Thr phosphatase [Solobacterium sp.]|nr:Stp1/IreP family PP2C-type Ser/Thr phosphatase [Solobacterium sp.]
MKYYGLTNKGLVRKTNQDSYVIAANGADDVFAIVCDGIGGNRGGDIASRMAIGYFSKAFSENDGFASAEEARQWIRNTVQEANKEIFTYGETHAKYKGLGTTFVGFLVSAVGNFIVNIGDSRAYAFWKNGRFSQLTSDHTLVNDLLMHGELTLEEAENYPRKNVLTNALGVWETVRADIDLHAEDFRGVLLCSDGLHGYVKEETIRRIVLDKDRDPSLRVRGLLKEALNAGGYDNVTAILIDMEGDEYGWRERM